MAFYSYLSTKIIIAFITKSYQDLFGVRSYINALFFGNYSVCAQHMISKQLPFFYQLSSNEIFDIYQDREGYLWIGTTNGLAR